jgi:hypothetical protein
MKSVIKALLVASFCLPFVSCSTGGYDQLIPSQPKWALNANDIPSLSEFDRTKKPAKPNIEQVKKCLQLRADDLVKDPESFKTRRVKIGGFYFFIRTSGRRDLDRKGYLCTADTDSKNSYGGYGGYQFGGFIIIGSGIPALTSLNTVRIGRESAARWDEIKKVRNKLSDEEWDKWTQKNDWVPTGQQDTYKISVGSITVDGNEVDAGWNYIKLPRNR